jgi:hypothetical protein
MTPTASESCSIDPTELRVRYETLRMAALGGPLAPEARAGLALFLRRGMWGWARTVLTSAPEGPTDKPSPAASRALDAREAVVRLLAQMAMNTHERRAS